MRVIEQSDSPIVVVRSADRAIPMDPVPAGDRAADRLRHDGELSGWGEMVVALTTIGTLLLTVWLLVAFGVLEGGAAPSLPEELGGGGHQAGEVEQPATSSSAR